MDSKYQTKDPPNQMAQLHPKISTYHRANSWRWKYNWRDPALLLICRRRYIQENTIQTTLKCTLNIYR